MENKDPCLLYAGFQRIEHPEGFNVQVNGDLVKVDDPDDFFRTIYRLWQLPRRLERAAYLDECVAHEVEPKEDSDCLDFIHGNYDYNTYFSTASLRCEWGVPCSLHRRRGLTVRAERAASVTVPTEAASVPPEGELWEPCRQCGAQPVHMPLHLCHQCWPADDRRTQVGSMTAQPLTS